MRKLGDSVDSLLSNILDSVSNSTPNSETKEKYVLPVKVGIKNEPIEKGDKPWIVGNFAPGKYLNETHKQGHDGVDLKAPPGTPIYPIGSGIVLDTANSGKGGINCKIAHENGAVISYYAHMKELRVKAQQNVLPTTIIGTVGDTGNAKGRGTHLHYEVKVDGGKVDPLSVVGKDVGSLSKMKKKSDEMFYDLVKMGGLLKYPQELYEEISNFAIKIFANIVYKLLEDKRIYSQVVTYIRKNFDILEFDIFQTNLNHSVEFLTEAGLNQLDIEFVPGGTYLKFTYHNSGFDDDENIIFHSLKIQLGKGDEILKLKSVDDFIYEIEEIKRLSRHESQHIQQEIYGEKTKLTLNDREIPYIGGLPPTKTEVKNRKYSPWGNDLKSDGPRQEYFNQDIEFYPLLTDSIEFFNRETSNLKTDKDDSENVKKQKVIEKRNKARNFVGDPFVTNETDGFFESLKNDSNQKWRKAVKEFYKMVFNE